MFGRKHVLFLCFLVFFGDTVITDHSIYEVVTVDTRQGVCKDIDPVQSGVSSLRNVMLFVEPSVVIRGGTAALICSRDMQGTPLYSVKWYRGNHEFFRYTPMEQPEVRVFGLPGIIVDMNRSNGTQVLLRRLDLSLAGNFSCEVTAESPSFATQIATKFIDIIALPPLGPVLMAEKDRYQVGELLRANCSSSPARPAANLTIYINDEPVPSSKTSLHPSDSGLLWSIVNVQIMISPEFFHGGRLRVTCVATVNDVYKKSAKLDFFTPDTDPRPERITLNNASRSFQNWIFLFLLFLLPLVVFGQDFESFNEDLFEEGIQYSDPESEEKSILSLIGG